MKPLVALETTVIAHGLPHPDNIETALQLETIIREQGAQPATIGVIEGRLCAGLMEQEIRHLATASDVRKVSRRDLPIVKARGLDGATTVASAIWIAYKHRIPVFTTGGIGGVHRGTGAPGTGSLDISADLFELSQTSITVVCSGAKAILDLPATLEVLETYGVTVVGYQTDEFPAFYSRSSGLSVDVRCDTPEEVAEIVRARTDLALPGATLVCVPIPEADEIPSEEITPHIEQAVEEARSRNLRSAELTPFLLARLVELTGTRSLHANKALLKNNARVAAQIATALAPVPQRIA